MIYLTRLISHVTAQIDDVTDHMTSITECNNWIIFNVFPFSFTFTTSNLYPNGYVSVLTGVQYPHIIIVIIVLVYFYTMGYILTRKHISIFSCF